MKEKETRFLGVKMQVPTKCRENIKRSSLLKQALDGGKSIIAVHGMAGCGKTEFVRQYCLECGRKVLWYTLDEYDNEETVFCHGMNQLFTAHFEGYQGFEKEEMEHCAGRGRTGELLRRLTEAAGGVTEQYVLVFDSFEKVGNPALDRFFRHLTARFPEQFRLIFISRLKVPGFLSRYVMDGRCLVIGEEELAFSKEEQLELARRILGEHGKAVVEGNKFEILAGWPAGVISTLLCMKRRGLKAGPEDWVWMLEDSLIFDFLLCEVYEKQTEEIKIFLQKTSCLLELEGNLCDFLFENGRSNAILGELLSRGFLERCETWENNCFRYKQLFRLFFKKMGGSADDKKTVKRAVEYYLEKREYKKAVDQAAACHCDKMLLKLAEDYGEEMLRGRAGEALGICVCYLEKQGFLDRRGNKRGVRLSTPDLSGVAAQYFYCQGEGEKAEQLLAEAELNLGGEKRYGLYRSLYQSLRKCREEPEQRERYEKQIQETVFLIQVEKVPMPYLNRPDRELLDQLVREGEDEAGREKKLRVTAFGDFKVFVIEAEKYLSWRTKKGSELFAYLVALNGRPEGRKNLLRHLWEEEQPANAVTMLHNMIYNIRKELAPYHMEELIQYKDKAYSLAMDGVETDISEVDMLCTLIDRGKAQELAGHASRFTAYWGRYLDDIDSEWAREQKEYYDNRFLKGCKLLASLYIERKNYQKAAVFLKNARLIDCYSEEIMSMLLECYGRVKNLKQLKCEYGNFCTLLEQDLGIRPGKALEEAYRKLLKAQEDEAKGKGA